MPPDLIERQTECGCRKGWRIRLHFRARPLAVRTVLSRIRRKGRSLLSPDCLERMELALAEVLNNVVEHGYCGRQTGPIDLTIKPVTGGILCRIVDRGWPMPDLSLPAGHLPDPNVGLQDLPEGGWGWALVRGTVSGLRYRQSRGRNIVVFRVPLASD